MKMLTHKEMFALINKMEQVTSIARCGRLAIDTGHIEKLSNQETLYSLYEDMGNDKSLIVSEAAKTNKSERR